jgi:hypothetical protein
MVNGKERQKELLRIGGNLALVYPTKWSPASFAHANASNYDGVENFSVAFHAQAVTSK